MKVDMLMPQMGESITEATISKWVKNIGDVVERDEIILEISTDKVDSEIPAPSSGVLTEVLFAEGDIVPVKTIIAVIDKEGSAGAAASTPKVEAKAEEEPTESVVSVPDSSTTVADSGRHGERFYSPLVKSLAEKHNIPLSELDSIQGSGHGNRLTKQDFLRFIDNRQGSTKQAQPTAQTNPPQQAAPQSPPPSTHKKVDMPGTEWVNGKKIVPMNGMRKAIAKHMVKSKQTSPHVYSVQEVDVTNIAKWRQKYKAEFKKQEGFNLSFTPFFLEAAIKGLIQFPYVNSSIEGESVILNKNVNLGCAVALGNTGLIVPVIKNAEEKNLVGVARSLMDLALRARSKKLMPEEVMNGTFTVTNPGVFGTMIGTPIINQPQVAILCLGAIEKRPVVIDDMIAIRQRCYLTLSYDHRIVDGSIGGQFLKFVTEYLQDWDMERPLY